MEATKELVSTGEAARMLNVSSSTVKRLWKKGHIDGYKLTPEGNSHLRLVKASVLFYKKLQEGRAAMEQWETATT